MKTKIVLLLLLGWVEVVFGQMKLLSECDSENFYYLKNSKTRSAFIKKIKENNDENLKHIIKKYTELELPEICENNVLEKKESLQKNSVYLYDDGDRDLCIEKDDNHQVLINKEIEVFVIVAKSNKKLLFYPDKGLFLIEMSKDQIDDKEKRMLMKFDSIGYECNGTLIKIVHESLFNTDLRVIEKAVILNTSDNVTNNNAVAFTNGTNDTKINIGANLNVNEKLFLNFGVYTADVKTGFLYTEKRWKSDIGALLTLNKTFNNGRRFLKDNINCVQLSDKRVKYRDSLINEYIDLEKSINTYRDQLNSLVEKEKKIRKSNFKYSDKDIEDLKDIRKRKLEVENEIAFYEKIYSDPNKYIDDRMIEFDKKSDALEGNKLHWFKATLDISNQNVKLDTTNFATLIKDGEIKNFPKLSLELSYNFNREKKTLLNVQTFLNVTMGSILDAGIGSEKPFLSEIDNDIFIIDKSGRQLGKYSYLKRAFWTLRAGAQSSYFFFNNFGVTGYIAHTFALQNMIYTDYRNRYSLLGGLVFKTSNDEDASKATFRIMAGVDNEPYHTRALKNSFMVKVSIGIPFGLFFKNKKEK
ncbi:hypothetical protein HX126_08085 [Chryseobacterium indologenes]|uniref:hypothetical protein n=1 Tax=Chryseobacterium indologenes TaxID=253 RepID=UPI0025769D43|nr:hypothetical protein [Chryseobacterium indologenes]MDM1554510.1 hypothetical protein [Chryseobacterium indologenes]